MRDWGLLYQRQPIQTDAILFAVALLLHAPLFTLHIKAPAKGAKGERLNRLHNIDIIEERTRARKEKPVALPPKVPDVKKIEDAVKKAQEMKERLMKKAAPPPPALPKPQAQQNLAAPLDPAKIQTALKQQLEQKTQQLKADKSFMDKPGQLPGAAGPKEIKMGGGAAAIQMGNRAGAPGGPGGPVVKGKSGFAVSEKSVPMGIGGGDGDIKMGGGAAIVVPVGSRARADSSILSNVASIKDKGSLTGKPGGGVPAGAGAGPGGSGLALGPGGAGGGIAVPGSRGAGAPLPASSAVSSKTGFSDKPAAGSTPALSGPLGGAGLGQVAALPKREPRAARPMFQITGPLANRPVLSKAVPEYPEWARAKGLEASVTLQFTVSPEGAVKSTIIVLRTSGDTRLDQTAVDALRQWRFQPLSGDQYRDEVGAITFQFSIR